MFVIGIESTAHTFGVGIVEEEKGKINILANAKDVFIPKAGSGIHPIEAARHHESAKEKVLEEALETAGISLNETDIVSYSAGPGLPPCLRVGLEFAKSLAKKIKNPIIPVNHCIAHIEIGKLLTKCSDPIILYVSGGNTQVTGYAASKYRVFGETLDISIGNAIDTFIRETTGEFPGGPIMEKLAANGKYTELPYVVKGMDLSFSGILTAALQKFRKGENINDLCFSFQETCYAMLTEVTERALAHTGKKEVLLTGGVAASQRLQEMLRIMCSERNAAFHACPKEFAGDNGAMIAFAGLLSYKNGQKLKADIYPRWRTDDVQIGWVD